MGRSGAWLKRKAPGLHRFLTRRDGKWPFLRDALAFVLVLGVLVFLLYGLTGQGMPFAGGYPVVVITTGSMMHCENGYQQFGSDCEPTSWGRIGTIDPGDLVFVQKVRDPDDVATLAEGGRSFYGKPGDVVVYRPDGDAGRTPIIHRALFWVEVHPEDGTYSVPALDLYRVRSLQDQDRVMRLSSDGGSCALDARFAESMRRYGKAGSGFVTRGDNNDHADQCSDTFPARLEWILGRARLEVPWVGLVNLLYGDLTTGSSHFADAGSDSKTMFFVTVAVFIAAPWVIEVLLRRRRRRRAEAPGHGGDDDGDVDEPESAPPGRA